MDRWSWHSGGVIGDIILKQSGVRIYDGDDKTSFDDGTITLSSTAILWTDAKNLNCVISLGLPLILQVQHASGGFNRNAKVTMHLTRRKPDSAPGPVSHSRNNFIRFSFKNGGDQEFHQHLMQAIQSKSWERLPTTTSTKPQNRIKGGGIIGIERKLEQKRQETEKNISVSFQDLSKLMNKAKEMVALSQIISTKIKDKQGDITEDETVKFKSYLLSLGIPNPVTKETHGSGTHYHMQLAREISDAMVPALHKQEGIILLTDVYCMLNRARGLELLSPEDLMNACGMFESMKLPVRMKTYESGVSVIQLESHSEEKMVSQTISLVEDSESLSAQQLANLLQISVFLAKERLLMGEKIGKLCRDESIEGLRFYMNKFLMYT